MGAGAFPREHLDALSQHPVSKSGTSSDCYGILKWIVHCVPSSGQRRVNNRVFIGELNTRPFSVTPVGEYMRF